MVAFNVRFHWFFRLAWVALPIRGDLDGWHPEWCYTFNTGLGESCLEGLSLECGHMYEMSV